MSGVKQTLRERVLRSTLTILALAGLSISAYLAWIHVSGATPICVGGSGGCEAVQSSRYSELLGVPVAILGIFAFAAMLAAAIIKTEVATLLGLFVALIGVLFSAYLTYLELFVIRAICQWCVASAVVVTTYFAVSLALVTQKQSRS